MPRTARLVLPDCAHHVVQRGHNRNAVFVQNRDYLRYLENLAEWTKTGTDLFSRENERVRRGSLRQWILKNRSVPVFFEYGYDPFGRRLWKEVGGVRTYFLYAEEGLVAEMDAGGAITRQYGWQPGGMWGTDPVYLSDDGSTYFYQNDYLGMPRKMAGVNGTVVWAATYKSFGSAQADVQRVDNPLRFPGQYHDQESDLDYNYLRFYEAETGRYTTSDPMGIFGGSNTYQYTLGNPLIRIDPWGLFCIPLPRGTTDWEEKWRSKRIVHTLTGVIFDDVRGPLGNCLWVKSQSVTEERKWRPRQLCFECDLCGGGDCGFKIKRGDWERERRHRSDTDLATSAAARIVIGNDIEVGDRWWCNNPWTGHRVTGKM